MVHWPHWSNVVEEQCIEPYSPIAISPYWIQCIEGSRVRIPQLCLNRPRSCLFVSNLMPHPLHHEWGVRSESTIAATRNAPYAWPQEWESTDEWLTCTRGRSSRGFLIWNRGEDTDSKEGEVGKTGTTVYRGKEVWVQRVDLQQFETLERRNKAAYATCGTLLLPASKGREV